MVRIFGYSTQKIQHRHHDRPAVVGWTQYARVVRGSVLSVKELDFVKASHLMGVSRPRLVVRHIVPNVIGHAIVLATMDMATVVLATAGLSFLYPTGTTTPAQRESFRS